MDATFINSTEIQKLLDRAAGLDSAEGNAW